MSWHSNWTSAFWTLGSYTSSDVVDNATEVYNILTGAGWTHNAACAVIGNLIHESTGINPGQFEGGHLNDWNYGFGIAQWTPGTKISDYCGSQAQGVADDGAMQMSYLLNTPSQWSTYFLAPDGTSTYYNLSGLPYITSMAQFAASNDTVYNLTMVWAICWERPSAQYAGFAARFTYADYYDTYFGSVSPGQYKVQVIASGNGAAYAVPAIASPGTTIQLTAAPASGESFLFWIVNMGGVTIDSNNQFVMPANDVLITANFTGYAPDPSPAFSMYFPTWLYWKWDELRRKQGR